MDTESIKKELRMLEFDHETWKRALPSTLSRRQVAKALDTTDSNLISIEKGISKPSILLAFKYCKLTHLNIADLVKIS